MERRAAGWPDRRSWRLGAAGTRWIIVSVDYRSVANWSSCSNPGGQRIGKPTVAVGQAVPDALLRVRHSLTYGNYATRPNKSVGPPSGLRSYLA
ncbi:hypothetical protein Fuma_06307 [Fuerstiella marisgermanici]|uniref:Uncharacterized protein n=1 Tax=Fuerstiella marisgermanici TaxID=1891926 RepID=A0A1P8WRF1_9PLAN|nr:hypothetical protein Fuma_06307 [Fuerstiella marisgermanici]